jgi:hypothetical protein
MEGDKDKMILGIDIWEGDVNLDYNVLKAAGVQYDIIRIDDTKGNLHLDNLFLDHWAKAEQAEIIHWPYYVYSPWDAPYKQYDWLKANVPADVKLIAIDVELKGNLSPNMLRDSVEMTLKMASQLWKVIIYTGGWFWQANTITQAHWMTEYEYWWARYPYALYPEKPMAISWEGLKVLMESTGFHPLIFSPFSCRLWQATADRMIMPGCGGKPIDVNWWNGTIEELANLSGYAIPVKEPTTQERFEERLSALEEWAKGAGYKP